MSAVSTGSGPLSSLGQQALEWARYRKVFPCWPRGKPPMIKGGFLKATQDPALVQQWWTQWPNANIGLPTGHENGIIVVDPDGEEGERLLAMVEKKLGKLPPTVEIETGKGRHLIFKLPEGCGRIPCSKGDGLDIRADGGYVIAPPSIHKNGKTYAFAKDRPGQLALAPQWLLERARNWIATLKAVDGPIAAEGGLEGSEGRPGPRQGKVNGKGSAFPDVRTPATEPWTPGGEARVRSKVAAIPAENYDIWRDVGFVLYDLEAADPRWPGRAIWDGWSKTSKKFNEAGQDKFWKSCVGRVPGGSRVGLGTLYHLAKEHSRVPPVITTCEATGDDAPIIEPKGDFDFSRNPRTDVGNAHALLDLFGADIRYIEKHGCWIVWDGARWVEASDLAMLPIAARVTREMMKWGVNRDSDREAWIKHALATQKNAQLRAMINIAKGEPRVRLEPKVLDADPWLLGCPNGTLDLRTGKLREARREDFITKQIGVAFDTDATCPRFREFLDWVTQGDRELAAFHQTFAGYALTGEVREEKMCVWFGDGDNGKSTLIMVMRDLLGDYAIKIRSDLLVHVQGKEGAPSPDVAALRGKRLAIISETEDGCLLSEARIKDTVSNEVIAARKLHCDPFEFSPTHKIILSTNHRPHVRGTDHGIWRRLAIVRFNATVEEEQKVADFRERFLLPELAGILNYFVEGLVRWGRDGLRLPASVRATTAEYRSEMDTVGQWIEERTEADPGAVTAVRGLYTDYGLWLGAQGRPVGARRFGEELERKGYAADRLPSSARARRGLKLKPPDSSSSFGSPHLQVVR